MKFKLEQDSPTRIMGILNLTDDSFYERSRVEGLSLALEAASRMTAAGVDILDVGAESTRPGSTGSHEERERAAVIPLVKELAARYPHLPLSVDTRKPSVAEAAVKAGAAIINDVSGLLLADAPQMIEVLKESEASYVLMHTRGEPAVMQDNCEYEDLWSELFSFFETKLSLLEKSGVDVSRVIIDPGIGFAKTASHNLAILANLPRLRIFGRPLLIGASRKGFIGGVSGGLPPEERLEGTLAISALCASQGVEILRVHDVEPNRRVVKMTEAICNAKGF